MVEYTRDVFADKIKDLGWVIGEHTYRTPRVMTFKHTTKLIIGKYCSIASGVAILLGENHRTDWVTTYPFNRIDKKASAFEGHPATRGDVVIGNDVWLGFSATILSGVTIGDGACIAADALVVKDVPPYTIVGGNPAKPIKMRFNEEQIEKLLSIRWWDWGADEISSYYKYFLSENIDKFIQVAQARPESHR